MFQECPLDRQQARPSETVRQEQNGKVPETGGAGEGGRGGVVKSVTAAGPLEIMAARISDPRSGKGCSEFGRERRLQSERRKREKG